MAPRFSAPSASVGINRFKCWPVNTTDSFNAAELTANWDYADALIGTPSSGAAWPPTTGLDGGIYRLITNLAANDAPIGTMSYWFRPSTLVPTTVVTDAGWHVADGTVLTAGQHSFPGLSGQTVALPNLLHMFIVGADVTKALGTAAATAGSGSENLAAGAPGPQGTGGANSFVQSVAQLPPHDHGGATNTVGFNNQAAQAYSGVGAYANDMYGVGANALNGEQGSHSHTITSQGGGAAIDIRPLYTGLVPIIKVMTVS